MTYVLVELGRGIAHHGAVAGTENIQVALPETREALQVGGQRFRIRGDEDAPLAEYGISGQRRCPEQKRQVIRSVTRSSQRLERPESAAVRQWDVDRASGGGDGDIRELTANRAGGLGVIGMLVCQRDSCEPSSTIGHLHQRFDVVMKRRTRI